MQRRFVDAGRQIYHFDDEFLVRCPQCAHRATVTRLKMNTGDSPALARLVCEHCGYTKDKTDSECDTADPVDGYFCLPLWLQIPCCGHTLWAFNERHLELVERYVAADLRETSDMTRSHTNIRPHYWTTLTASLPEWIIQAKHRDEVLRCIAKLRQTL
jgi:hypothetical protein